MAIYGKEQRTAIHEAGHAVIGRALTMTCGYASIIADHDSAGHHIVADPWVIYGIWDAAEKYRDFASVLRGRIMTMMAGAAAEEEMLGSCLGGDDDDRHQSTLMVQDLGRGEEYLSRLRRQARRLVRNHREAIQAVADELLRRKTLSSEEIDRVIGAVQSGQSSPPIPC